ncbi:MAG: radical SAM protein [Syntrophus sp. (in: bacteria)]|nr:radical SAM protein [Syntrophus sp. (in: bacteria)]
MRCSYCERRCEITEGKTGVCRMYTVSEGIIKERFPHRWSSCGASRLEAVPFYHAYPGSRCLAIGTTSCNFRCQYCSNAFIAKEDPEIQQDLLYQLTPHKLVSMAQKLNCRSIIFNVNEPTVSLPSLLDVAQEAKAAAIPMGCLTNGYMTVESTELLASIFSFFNVSLKGLSSHFNKKYVGIESCKPVLRNIRRLAGDRHVEVTTPIIQGTNDCEIDTIADFLTGVDPEIPWHVFRLLPEDEMMGTEYPNIQAIDAALQSARKKLPYIYFHNFVGSEWVNTHCPACGSVVIERFSLGCGGDKLNMLRCEDNRCPDCGQKIKVLNEKTPFGNKGV